MRTFQSVFFVSCLMLASGAAFAQSTNLPLGSKDYQTINRLEIKYGKLPSQFYSGDKPILRQGAVSFVLQMDSLTHNPFDSAASYLHLSGVDKYNMQQLLTNSPEWVNNDSLLMKSKHPFLKTFYKNPAYLYSVNIPDFFLTVNPILLLQFGKENDNDETMFINTRGIEVRGRIANKIGFYTRITENQERDPLFVQQKINQYEAVPGAGYYKNYNSTGVDYINANAYFTFNVTKYINVQFGYGKNFIGDGYRSLFLSDYSSNYLYLKLNTHIWKINYQNIFAELTSQYLRDYGDYLRPKKYAAMHDLSFDVTKWINVGAFESIIFSRKDHFEFQYLNPLIFYRAAEQATGSPDNANVGFHAKANVAHHLQLYSQFLFDELRVKDLFSTDGWWGNKWSWQAGVKYVDAFGVDNLDLQGEINIARPYTYSHYDSVSNYTNYNQPLADPLGANFKEFIGTARYQPLNKLILSARIIYYNQGKDTTGVNWGSDVFKDYDTHIMDYGNHIGQGFASKVANLSLVASYEIKYNLFIDLSYLYRKSGGVYSTYYPQKNTEFIAAALRWNIGRRQYDY